MKFKTTYKAIVLGASAGGLQVIREIIKPLPENFSLPLIIVQHISSASKGMWAQVFADVTKLPAKEADEKEPIKPGTIYLAPPNYHLLIEQDFTFSLTVDERVNYARPSIDVLFDTAAQAYGGHLVGIICTGANFDGAKGLFNIKKNGGLTIVQHPDTAHTKAMPRAAIEMAQPDYILPPDGITELLLRIHDNQTREDAIEN